MVSVVDEDGPPPQALRLGWMCERWGALPETGGMYDQDAETMMRMTVALNVHQALSRMRSLQGAEIHSLTNAERKIIKALLDLGLL